MARKKVALILSGGGARGAYQIGVLDAWRDIFQRGGSVEIIIGVSAGSINAVRLMQNAPDYVEGIDAVKNLWSGITTDDIFESGIRSAGGNLMRLLGSSRNSESIEQGSIANSMLNTAPLRTFLESNIDIKQVHQRLRTLPDHALAVNCFDYSDGRNVTFFQTLQAITAWERPTARGRRAALSLDHVMASCAVPLIFPPVQIEGHYYGDGSLRNLTPLQSAIHMGADRIINISLSSGAYQGDSQAPTLGRIVSTLFDGMFVDALAVDTKYLSKVNALTAKVPEKDRDTKTIEFCRIAPLVDFSVVAQRHRDRFPKGLRFLLGGWITPDMLSYLLFDGEFTRELMEFGRKDGEAYRHKVEEWLG